MRRYRRHLLIYVLFLVAFPGVGRALTPYPYGTLPSSASLADVTNAYNTWKSRWLDVESCGDSVYNGSGTVSEGMGYGMLMAAYLESNDTLLEQLWTFYKANYDTGGLMNWSVASNSCVNNNANAATDGDLDAACALIRASKRWPASANNWAVAASTQLNNIYLHEVDSCKGLANGDAWGGCTNGTPKNYNPSYFRTGYLHSFDCFEGGTRWQAVRTQSYSVLNYSYTNDALTPDWVLANGQYGASDASGGYGYDACRTPWAVGMDFLWWGNSSSQGWGQKFTTNFYSQGGNNASNAAASIGDDYNYSTGAKDSSNYQNCFIGAVGVAAMATTYTAFANDLYTDMVGLDNHSYFSDSLKVVYLMAMTGVFQEPCSLAAGSPTETPTDSPTVTPSPSFSPSVSPSVTATRSATATPSVTPSVTATGTVSATPTITYTSTPSSTWTVSPSATETWTPVPPGSSATDSPTFSPTGSATMSPSVSPTRSATPSRTVSPTASLTVTPGWALGSPTPGSSPTQGGPLDIVQQRAWPDPYTQGSLRVGVKLSGYADFLTLKLFSKAMVLMAEDCLGPSSAGWVEISVPQASGLPNGLYYYEVLATRSSITAAPSFGKLAILR